MTTGSRKIDAKGKLRALAYVEGGGTLKDAAKMLGVCYKTLFNARKQDPAFDTGIAKAETEVKLRLIKRVGTAKQWQAAAWMLERKWGAEFGKKDQLYHSGRGAPIRTESEFKIDYEALARELASFAGGQTHRRISENGNGQSVHTEN